LTVIDTGCPGCRALEVILAAMLEELTPEQYERVRAALRQHDASLLTRPSAV
jgi:hypothetical protein